MGLLARPCVRESSLYVKLSGERVQCVLCERRCILDAGQLGVCRTRQNVDGMLYTLVYGDLSAVESRPVEIKPFFHYWPGSTALTFSTWSCNFGCPWCQNYNLSKTRPVPERSKVVMLERIVQMAIDSSDEGVCASFQEPTLLTDWAVELFVLAKRLGLYCCYVSNGYMTPEALNLLRQSGLDGLKIDIKGDEAAYRNLCGSVDASVPWRNAEAAKEMGIHVEIVNLVIPGVNDSDANIAHMIEKHLGPETPIHFTRYIPAYRFDSPSTSVRSLERAREMARRAGVKYPYIGNVRGHIYENTFCPRCGECIITRNGCSVLSYRLTERSTCPKCSTKIPIVGKYTRSA